MNPDDDHKEELARMRAENDQAKEGTKEFVAALWTFYSESVGAGFTADQAFGLTAQWMSEVMQQGGEPE